MNTIGKLLVVLNFIFAVVVGVILVFSIAFRTPWKEKYLELIAQVKVRDANYTGKDTVQFALANDLRAKELDLEKLKQKLKDTEDAMKAAEDVYKITVADYTNKLKDKDLVVQESLKNVQRLTDEVTVLNKTIGDRQNFITTLQQDVRKFQISAQSSESLAKARQSQNEALIEENARLERELARRDTGIKGDTPVIVNPNAPNPPAGVVNGKIERVDDKDGTLLQINVGTDHGVNKHNTLDIYRLAPDAKYLGMIRIVEAYHQKSVARFVYTGNAAYRPQLREGDAVTSKITR
jgi:hypothetical protein